MKTLGVSIQLIALVLLLAACGRAATPQPVTMTIEMTEFKFNPNSLDLKVGQQVTLELVNNGQLQHEIMFGRRRF
jgi:plastocyanin